MWKTVLCKQCQSVTLVSFEPNNKGSDATGCFGTEERADAAKFIGR